MPFGYKYHRHHFGIQPMASLRFYPKLTLENCQWRGNGMKKLLNFAWLMVIRLRNRALIYLYQRPESAFFFLLLFLLGAGLVAFAPALFSFHIDMVPEMFPTAAYIFLIGGLMPYIFFMTRGKASEDTEGSLLHYITASFLKHLKNIFAFVSPCVLSVILLYLILSIYDNIHLPYALLYWEGAVQVYFLTAYAIERILQKGLSYYITPRYQTLTKYGIFLGLLSVELAIPIHRMLGRWWLSKSVPGYVLFLLLLMGFAMYLLVSAIKVEYRNQQLMSQRRLKWLKRYNLGYSFLVIVHSKDYWLFNFFSAVFIAVISKLANHYSSMNDVYVLAFILGGTSFIFANLTKTTEAIAVLRLSHIKYIGHLLHLYFVVGAVFLLLYLRFIASLHHLNFYFLLNDIDYIHTLIMFYFCLYAAIVIYYLFHRFFGTFAQLISSIFILLMTYRVLPEFESRVEELGTWYGVAAGYGFAAVVLVVIVWLVIGGYQNETTLR